MKVKVSHSTDKHTWHPSPLMGQIVLVTSLNQDGSSNIAPKSWISMMAFEPPLLALGCNMGHWTAKNILRSREFVVNVPGVELVETVWACHSLPHPRPIEAAGLTPIPSLRVKPQRIEECKAHIECTLDHHLAYGDEVILIGRIEAITTDENAGYARDPYEYLQMIVFLEDETYGVIERGLRVTGG
ncbi:MAG: flavin reductase family protein [Candidatus Glassbacteria bacterium]